VPDYWGQKAKDTVTAIVFIWMIDDLAWTNNWNDTTAYANVANALKGFARDWIFVWRCSMGQETNSHGQISNRGFNASLQHKRMTNRSSTGYQIWL
jgi:hypothetical protein